MKTKKPEKPTELTISKDNLMNRLSITGTNKLQFECDKVCKDCIFNLYTDLGRDCEGLISRLNVFTTRKVKTLLIALSEQEFETMTLKEFHKIIKKFQ